MTTALVLAAALCATPPLFDLTGPECDPSRFGTPCACSEGFTWDPPAVAGSVDFYEIRRRKADDPSGTWVLVGDTSSRTRPTWTDDEGSSFPPVFPTAWFVAWDGDGFPLSGGMPLAGVAYYYSVRAAKGTARGAWSVEVLYVAAPYVCFVHGGPAPCITTERGFL